MTLIIKSQCIDIKDGDCTKVCPVDCIYEGGRMFYIHPVECIECGICESVCPVDAIAFDDEVSPQEEEYVKINREYFEECVTGLGDPGGWDKSNTTDMDHPVVDAFTQSKDIENTYKAHLSKRDR
jgi:NAD-dependent dihydropyrimidine dehydrogenase PreA subunit